HAAGLGLSVTVSHTIGVLVVAAIVLWAQSLLPPDAVIRGAPVVAAIGIVIVGGWMLASALRRRRRGRSQLDTPAPGTEHPRRSEDADHDHDHDPLHVEGEHRHGGLGHSHLPASGTIG